MALAFFVSVTAQAQLSDALQLQYDSLELLVKNAEHDSLKVAALQEQGALVAPYDSKESERLHLAVVRICDSIRNSSSETTEKQFFGKATAISQGALGVNYFLAGKLSNALTYELKALEGCLEYNMDDRIGRCYIIIGAIYKSQGNYVQSLVNQRKALAINQKVDNKAGMALAINNIGTAYMEIDSVEQARDAFRRCFHIYAQLQDKRGMGVAYVNLGSAYKKLKVLDSARFYFERSLDIRNEIKDLQGLIFSNARLGNLLHEQKKNDEALVYANKSLELATEKGYPRGIRDANELLYKIFKAQGQHKAALQFFERHIEAKDSLADEEAIRKVAKAQSSFKYRKEIAEDSIKNAEGQKAIQIKLDLQAIETQQQRQKGYFLWGGILLALILGAFVYNRYQNSEKQKRTIEEQKALVEETLDQITQRDEEKELLLKEIHHRVKNNLQVVSSLLELQAKKGDESTKTAFADGQSRVKAMALIHEKLYRNDDIASIDFAEYIEQLSGQIASLYSSHSVEIHIEAGGHQFDIDTAVPLGLILNELITNSFKYAFNATGGQLHISVAKAQDGYELIVADNGPGLPEDFNLEKAKSLGLRLVRRLSRQLYGKASYTVTNGARFCIQFKDTLQRKEVE